MAKHVWHTKDRRVVEFTPDQAALDAVLVENFQGLEVAHAKGEAIASDDAGLKSMLAAMPKLPPERAVHWRAELQRIGAVAAEVKAEVSKPAATKPTEQKSSDSNTKVEAKK